MNRREFLKSLAALTATVALPTEAITRIVQQWNPASGLIEGQTFYVSKTLILPRLDKEVIVRGCTFIAQPGLIGPMLELVGGKPGDVTNVVRIEDSRFVDRRNVPTAMLKAGEGSTVHITGMRAEVKPQPIFDDVETHVWWPKEPA